MWFPRSRAILLIAAILSCSVLTCCGYANPSNNYESIPRDQQPFTKTVQPSSIDSELDSVNNITSNEAIPHSVSSSREQPNELLSKLNNLASFALKILCIVTLAEVVKFLNNYRKNMLAQQQRREKRLQQRRNQDSSVQAPPDLFDFDSASCDALPMIAVQQSPLEPCSMPDESPAANNHLNSNFDTAQSDLLAPQIAESNLSDKTALFEFQTPDKALKILDGAEQGCIYLKKSANGRLVGIQTASDLYRVAPRTLEMPERNLKYSAIAACFNISWEVEGGKVLKVRIDNEALLKEADAGIYEIVKKGRLTVIAVIE